MGLMWRVQHEPPLRRLLQRRGVAVCDAATCVDYVDLINARGDFSDGGRAYPPCDGTHTL
eukprot:gene32912-846_t